MKQWWVAKQLGVHRKTVSRWINRHVRTTTNELAEALAALLRVSVSEILAVSGTERFASVADQIAAARLFRHSRLIDRLGPVGEWETIERLIRATMVGGVGRETRSNLPNQLSIAAGRRGDITRAGATRSKPALSPSKVPIASRSLRRI
jgi:transcriptional regulator with XRE-family HTH domain